MKKISRTIFFSILICSLTKNIVAQNRAPQWQIGYFAPYLTNTGVTVGFAYDVKKWEGNLEKVSNSEHRIQVLTQLGYFSQLQVAQNILLNPEIVYKWNKSGKRFFLSYAIGASYLISFQRQEGTLNLATGSIDYRNNVLNYFLPDMNIGFGLDPKKNFGFYFKTTYGRKLSRESANGAFFALSTGLIIKLK